MLLDVVEVTATLLCAGQFSGGPLHGDLVIARINMYERGAGLHRLVVVDRHGENRTAHPRGDLDHVRLGLGIVGRLLTAGQPQPDADADQENGKNGNDDTQAGYQREPPR
jgi:hypothetical protein